MTELKEAVLDGGGYAITAHWTDGGQKLFKVAGHENPFRTIRNREIESAQINSHCRLGKPLLFSSTAKTTKRLGSESFFATRFSRRMEPGN